MFSEKLLTILKKKKTEGFGMTHQCCIFVGIWYL
jgi:hypothetical protein